MKLNIKFSSSRLEKALKKFPDALMNNIGMAQEMATRDIQIESVSNHKYESITSAADRSIVRKVEKKKLRAAVGFDKSIAKHGPFLHDGTKAHKIKPKIKKALGFVGKGGRFVFSAGVNHPGTKAEKHIVKAGKKLMPKIQNRMNEAVKNASVGSFA